MADVRHHALALAVAVVAGVGPVVPVRAQVAHDAVPFLTVEQGQDEFKADVALAAHLSGLVEPPQPLSYNQIVQDVIADEQAGGTVARLTPYAFVVAEMMGARLDLLATYSSRSTKSTTYNAYFVVRRDFVAEAAGAEPTLAQLMATLRERNRLGRPARFVYHDQLSTSSYFLPSLFFRAQRVFAASGAPTAEVTSIVVARHEPKSSSELVRAVAGGEADIASVWDGTRARFLDEARPESAEIGRQVWFLRLPSDLPCDLLVATAKVDDGLKKEIREGLAAQVLREEHRTAAATENLAVSAPRSALGDVEFWVPWSDGTAEGARTALSILRRQAMAPPAPVVVDVRTTNRAPVSREELEAVRQAIRLAGTEFVPKHEYFDYFKQHEVQWVLSRIHDGAVRLTVLYDHFKLGGRAVAQQFDISFVQPDDLTRRVGTLIHSRMHRIRPIWLYNDRVPTVIRDIDFDVPVGARLPLQEIEWSDPEHNGFRVQDTKDIAVVNSDFHTFRFDAAPFAKRNDNTLDFEPMGRVAYRVLVMRTEEERPLFRALTVALVGLFVLAAAGLAWDVRRASRRRPHEPPALEVRRGADEDSPGRTGDAA
jgi:ABC-type phosphate/phosphonate transport system substrate-binding protein